MGGLFVDPFDEDVDVFGGSRPSSEYGNVSRDVDVFDVKLIENFGESDRQLVELIRFTLDDECSISQFDTAHSGSFAGGRINCREEIVTLPSDTDSSGGFSARGLFRTE